MEGKSTVSIKTLALAVMMLASAMPAFAACEAWPDAETLKFFYILVRGEQRSCQAGELLSAMAIGTGDQAAIIEHFCDPAKQINITKGGWGFDHQQGVTITCYFTGKDMMPEATWNGMFFVTSKEEGLRKLKEKKMRPGGEK